MNTKTIDGLARRLGPGLITGAADDDPSEIATYSQAGAQFRFGLVWTLLLTTPLINIAADVGAMAEGVRLLAGGHHTLYIVIATAVTLNEHGVTGIQTASQAAEALRPVAGEFAFAVFAMGIVGTGLLAVPVLAGSAAYAVSEVFGWKAGLSHGFHEARGFYLIIAAATGIGTLMSVLELDPIKALVWSAVVNGVISVPIMGAMMWIGQSRRLMGELTISRRHRVFGWAATVVMAVAVIVMLVTLGTRAVLHDGRVLVPRWRTSARAGAGNLSTNRNQHRCHRASLRQHHDLEWTVVEDGQGAPELRERPLGREGAADLHLAASSGAPSARSRGPIRAAPAIPVR